MNKFLYVLLVLGGFVVLYGVGRTWKLLPETKYEHELHPGEAALVTSKVGDRVWVAANQKDCYGINIAMVKKDAGALKAFEDTGAAMAVPLNTLVKVLWQSESRVKLEVSEGAFAGKQGWVEFEYVRPRKAGEYR
jgi:hypothetical protein